MIGELNRQNPYIIQITENMEPLRRKSLNAMTLFMRNSIIGFLMMGLGSLFSFSWMIMLILQIIWAYDVVIGYQCIRKIMKSSPLSEITMIIYGNQYEKIYVNNERLLQMIQNMSAFDKSLDVITYYTSKQFKRLFVLSIGISIIRWIFYFI